MGVAFADAHCMSTSSDAQLTGGEELRRCEAWRLLLQELQDEAIRVMDTTVRQMEWRVPGLWQQPSHSAYARNCCVYIEEPAGNDAAELEDILQAMREDVPKHFGCEHLVIREDLDFHSKQSEWLSRLHVVINRTAGEGGSTGGDPQGQAGTSSSHDAASTSSGAESDDYNNYMDLDMERQQEQNDGRWAEDEAVEAELFGECASWDSE